MCETVDLKRPTPGSRIIILGCSGSGKSTFARELHARTGLPLFHLDNVWWKPDRTHITREAFDSRLEDILRGGKWIVDGDYSRTYEPRFAACDTVVFLDYSEEDCLRGVRQRIGKARPDIPWVEDGLDPELVELVKNYRRDNRPKVFALLDKYPDRRVFIFKTRALAEQWLNSI